MNVNIKAISRLTISRHDLEQCQNFLQQLEHQRYGSVLYEALLIAAIVFYARPFSSNERNKDANADSRIDEQVLDQLNNEERELHKTILTLRNQAIAHAEWTHYPTGVSKNRIIMSMPFSIWKYFQNDSEIAAFSSLVEKVLLRAHHLTADELKNLP